jgi:amino acid transporter
MPTHDTHPEPSEPGMTASYPVQLRRSLTFTDLVVYGIVFMIPIAPFAIFGYISDIAKGMVVLAYLVGMVAMFFTAYSYKLLSADFPVAGSVYAYAYRAIGERTGFVAGWMLVLDYLLCPSLAYVAAAISLHEIVPWLPRWTLVVAFLCIGTTVNYAGMKVTALVNKVFLAIQLVVLAVFLTLGLYALYHGAGAGRLTMSPLFQPGVFSVGLVLSAVSLCALSFLGFDAISTLAEEVKGDSRRIVGNATIASLLLAGMLFILQTWIAADLANGMAFASPDTAFYEIAAIAGGKVFSTITACATALVFGISCAIVAQASVSRLLFAMARDGKMPAFMAAVHPRYRTPHLSLLPVAGLSLAVSLAFLDHLDLLSTFINFGAMSGFLILHVTVVVHFMVRKRSRSYVRHLLCPAIGFGILAYVLYYMGSSAWELGLAWLALGLLYYGVVVRKFSAHRKVSVEAT